MQLTIGSFKESISSLGWMDAYNMYMPHQCYIKYKKTIWNPRIASFVKSEKWFPLNKTWCYQMCDPKLFKFSYWKVYENNYCL